MQNSLQAVDVESFVFDIEYMNKTSEPRPDGCGPTDEPKLGGLAGIER